MSPSDPTAGEPGRIAWWPALRRVYANIGRHHLSIVAAGVAFFAVLAIFPGLAALVGLYGLVADPAEVMATLHEARPLLPDAAYALIASQLQALIDLPPQRLGLAFGVSLFLALWTVRTGVATLIQGLDIVYRETDTRGFVVAYAGSFVLTVLLLLIACAALLATVALPTLLHFVRLGPLGAWLTAIGPLLILGVAVVFLLGALYRYGPPRDGERRRWVTLGAVAATIVWVIASALLSAYISSFADLNRTYGSLGAIAALMLWFYVSAFVVLLGAELNAALERQA